jgi:hypothetical protein
MSDRHWERIVWPNCPGQLGKQRVVWALLGERGSYGSYYRCLDVSDNRDKHYWNVFNGASFVADGFLAHSEAVRRRIEKELDKINKT